MYFNPWTLLGLDPTDDTVAIKRAYARELKKTRPDDDPEGYQRLRTAYQQALDWARASRADRAVADDADEMPIQAESEDEPEAEPVDPLQENDALRPPAHMMAPLDRPPEDSAPRLEAEAPRQVHGTPAEEKDQEPGPVVIDLPALLQEMAQRSQEEGGAALLEAWPSLEFALRHLPLGLQSSASLLCARFVLEYPRLPPQFLLHLADFFQWGVDYRVDTQLQDLAQDIRALRKAAEDDIKSAWQRAGQSELENMDAGVLVRGWRWGKRSEADEHAERRSWPDILRLHHLIETGRPVRAFFHALLAHPGLLDGLLTLGDGSTRLSREQLEKMRSFGTLAGLLRLVLLILLVTIICPPVDPDRNWAEELAWNACAAVVVWVGALVAQTLGNLSSELLRHCFPRLMQGDDWRFITAFILTAVTMTLATMDVSRAGLDAYLGSWSTLIAIMVPCLSVALIWPRQTRLRAVVVHLAVLLCYMSYTGTTDGLASAVGVGLSWVCLLMWAMDSMENDLYRITQQPGQSLKGLFRWLHRKLFKGLFPKSPGAWIVTVLLVYLSPAILCIGLLLGAPLFVLMVALSQSRYTGLAIVGITLAWGLAPQVEQGPYVLLRLLIATCAVVGLLVLSRWLWRLAGFERVPAPPLR